MNPGAAAIPFVLFWVLDFGRYTLTVLVLAVDECLRRWSARRGRGRRPDLDGASVPLVSVIMAGHNEADSMPLTLKSLAEQTWPKMEVIVVDDGSTDGTSAEVRSFLEQWSAYGHPARRRLHDPLPWARIVTLDRRNGKAAALNVGLMLARGPLIVFVDADTTFDRDAIFEIVRPMLEDPRCGAVAGNLVVRNATDNALTQLVATEYLFSISMGRRFRSLVNLLNVVSGAFGAFRRDILDAVGGHAPTSGNDGDLTLKVRRLTERIAFAHQAICRTKTPKTWKALVKQRRRWDRNLVKNKLRRHRDLLDVASPRFRLGDAVLVLDALFFNVVLGSRWVAATLLALWIDPAEVPSLLALSYLIHLGTSLVKLSVAHGLQAGPVRERLRLLLFLPLYPFYKAILRVVRLYAYFEEVVHQASYADVFAPAAVSREALAFDNDSRLRLRELAAALLWPWRRGDAWPRRAAAKLEGEGS
jgi:cellulose synthase/poly-beta-1,6-N-acetylglucosamine synthase-like glycosyltransferase